MFVGCIDGSVVCSKSSAPRFTRFNRDFVSAAEARLTAMRPMYFLLVSLLLGLSFPSAIDASDFNDFSCNCEYCDEQKVKGIEESERDNGTAEEEDTLNMEDADGDGNRTICARDRDEDDRSFPSICHMLCRNNCTRYRIWIYVENKEKKYEATAFRNNYYKLHDGPC